MPDHRLDPRYLRYQLQTRGEELQSRGAGSTFLELSGSALAAIRIHVPARAKQQKIADFLDRECERIAELRSTLREYAGDVLGPALEQFRWLTARTDLGRIGYRFEVQLGKMLDGKRTAGEMRPYLRNANVHWDRLELEDLKEMAFTEAERAKFALAPGDLLVCEGGEPGRSAVWNSEIEDCHFQKALHRVRPYGADSTRFLLWCLRDLADRGAFTSDGPGRYIHLPAEQLRAVRVPLPAADEQDRVASAVDAAAQRSSTIRTELEAMDRALTEYRDALITEAVTGKLDVTRLSDQQMDESARAAMEGEAAAVEVWTDGSCLRNPGGAGGWAAVIVGQGIEQTSGGEASTTNNRMEIMAAIEGLARTRQGVAVTVYSDSRYLVNTMTRGWRQRKNADLWKRLDAECAARRVQWCWVPGHSSHPHNVRADELAGQAARQAKCHDRRQQRLG